MTAHSVPRVEGNLKRRRACANSILSVGLESHRMPATRSATLA